MSMRNMTKDTSRKTLSSYNPGKFTRNGRSRIVNDFGSDHASPHGGKTVASDTGSPVAPNIDEEHRIGVGCQSDEAVSVMLGQQASRSIDNRVVCGSRPDHSAEDALADEIAGENENEMAESEEPIDDDDPGGDDIEDTDDGMDDDMDDEDMASTERASDDGDEETSTEDDGDGSASDEDAAMASVEPTDAVDAEGELPFVEMVGNRVAAFMIEVHVATFESVDEETLARVNLDSGCRGVETVVRRRVVRNTLAGAGFGIVGIEAGAVPADVFGSIDGRGQTLADPNIDSSDAVAARMLSRFLPGHGGYILDIAASLMGRADMALDTPGERISRMAPQEVGAAEVAGAADASERDEMASRPTGSIREAAPESAVAASGERKSGPGRTPQGRPTPKRGRVRPMKEGQLEAAPVRISGSRGLPGTASRTGPMKRSAIRSGSSRQMFPQGTPGSTGPAGETGDQPRGRSRPAGRFGGARSAEGRSCNRIGNQRNMKDIDQ